MVQYQQRGFVIFPVDRADPQSGNGLFVRLVVVDDEDLYKPDDDVLNDVAAWNAWCARTDTRWRLCHGGTHQIQYDETFMGDDVNAPTPAPELPNYNPERGVGYEDYSNAERYHFPRITTPLPDVADPGYDHSHRVKYGSRPYLATINLGTTRYSGDFVCTYEDLTADGKALYQLLQTLYPGCRLFLQTWLDT